MRRSCPDCKGDWTIVTLNVGRDKGRNGVTVSDHDLVWEGDETRGFYRTKATSDMLFVMTDVSDWNNDESLARFLAGDLQPGEKGTVRVWRQT